jgi:hypothetical protein
LFFTGTILTRVRRGAETGFRHKTRAGMPSRRRNGTFR